MWHNVKLSRQQAVNQVSNQLPRREGTLPPHPANPGHSEKEKKCCTISFCLTRQTRQSIGTVVPTTTHSLKKQWSLERDKAAAAAVALLLLSVKSPFFNKCQPMCFPWLKSIHPHMYHSSQTVPNLAAFSDISSVSQGDHQQLKLNPFLNFFPSLTCLGFSFGCLQLPCAQRWSAMVASQLISQMEKRTQLN